MGLRVERIYLAGKWKNREKSRARLPGKWIASTLLYNANGARVSERKNRAAREKGERRWSDKVAA